MKIGLKIWSTNDSYVKPAIELFSQKTIDYIELFVVQNSEDYIDLWRDIKIPFILHAPHSYTGLNFSLAENEHSNTDILKSVDNYYKCLNPQYIVFHPGILGTVTEVVRQIKKAQLEYPNLMKCAIIENKPMIGIKGEQCLGATFTELQFILQNTNLGFCLDFGHAICAACSQEKDWKEYLEELLTLKPLMYHISDGHINSPVDEHLNIGKGDYDFNWITSYLTTTDLVSIETKKSSINNLDDFKTDCFLLNRIVYGNN